MKKKKLVVAPWTTGPSLDQGPGQVHSPHLPKAGTESIVLISINNLQTKFFKKIIAMYQVFQKQNLLCQCHCYKSCWAAGLLCSRNTAAAASAAAFSSLLDLVLLSFPSINYQCWQRGQKRLSRRSGEKERRWKRITNREERGRT